MKTNPWRAVYDSPESKDPWNNPSPFALHIDVEPTNRCNMKCKFCNRNRMTRPIGDMLFETFSEIVNQGTRYGAKGVRFLRWGEPLLNFATTMFIRKAHDAGLLTHMTTNGLNLDGRIKPVTTCGLDSIIVSLQGCDRSGYEAMRGDHYEKVTDNIKRLREASDKLFITVSTSVTDETEEQIAAFNDKWLKIVDDVSIGRTMFGRMKNKEDRTSKLPTLFKCQEIMTKLAVQWDGSISPCCIDYNDEMVLGNVMHDDMMDIWNSELRKSLCTVTNHKRQDLLTLCRECELNYGFRGQE